MEYIVQFSPIVDCLVAKVPFDDRVRLSWTCRAWRAAVGCDLDAEIDRARNQVGAARRGSVLLARATTNRFGATTGYPVCEIAAQFAGADFGKYLHIWTDKHWSIAAEIAAFFGNFGMLEVILEHNAKRCSDLTLMFAVHSRPNRAELRALEKSVGVKRMMQVVGMVAGLVPSPEYYQFKAATDPNFDDYPDGTIDCDVVNWECVAGRSKFAARIFDLSKPAIIAALYNHVILLSALLERAVDTDYIMWCILETNDMVAIGALAKCAQVTSRMIEMRALRDPDFPVVPVDGRRKLDFVAVSSGEICCACHHRKPPRMPLCGKCRAEFALVFLYAAPNGDIDMYTAYSDPTFVPVGAAKFVVKMSGNTECRLLTPTGKLLVLVGRVDGLFRPISAVDM